MLYRAKRYCEKLSSHNFLAVKLCGLLPNVLGNLPASRPCVCRPKRIESNNYHLDTTRRFALIPSQWFPADANTTPARFWNRPLHAANRGPGDLLQTKSDSLRPADVPAPLKLKGGSSPALDSKLPPARQSCMPPQESLGNRRSPTPERGHPQTANPEWSIHPRTPAASRPPASLGLSPESTSQGTAKTRRYLSSWQ